EDSPRGRVLHRVDLDPERVSWSARKISLPLDISVIPDASYAIRLQSPTTSGCYGFAFRDDLASAGVEAFVSTDAGTTWTVEPTRSVKIELSF
ncbi:MAG: hypothetical protein KY464_17340, partial [Gemmatimonadetes bacterium]|nr:hypothetical protein [Gemmatimonadota bacterium]